MSFREHVFQMTTIVGGALGGTWGFPKKIDYINVYTINFTHTNWIWQMMHGNQLHKKEKKYLS